MQLLPSQELSSYIKHYLFLESEGNIVKKLRLFSDGNTGMVFCLKESFVSGNTSALLPRSFIYGQISEFKDLYLTNDASFVIVVFQPDGIYKLLGIPAGELKDEIIGTETIFGLQGLLLHEKLAELPALPGRINMLNRFFHHFIARQSPPGELLIGAALDFITTKQGSITIQQLVKHTGYSERHIERAFAEHVGISPKKFGNIVKLHFFLKLLKTQCGKDKLTSVCYDSGYFDQSHLIREFKKYTGLTPTEYLNSTNRLATNFMEFTPANLSMAGLYNLSS